MHCPVRPKCSSRGPISAKPFVVCYCVLDDQGLYTVRVKNGHAETDWSAIVLHVQRVAAKAKSFSEAVHDLSIMIKRVSKLCRIRPIAMAKARVVWSNQVVSAREPAEERLEHPRRRRKTVEKKDRRRVLGSRFSIED